MYDVMVKRESDNKTKEIFEWLSKMGLQVRHDWFYYTMPGASKMKFSFFKEEHAIWFKLRWLQ